MKTLHLIADPAHLDEPSAIATLDRAARILRDGGLVALPTETVYGLGANALDKMAVERIFTAKQRPAWDPIIVHIADTAMLCQLVTEIPAAARRLIETFWPGPLTLLMPRSAAVPDAVTAGRRLVGIRMPAHPVAIELIRRAAVPIAAPSANRFAHISPTTAAHVLQDLNGRIDAVLDAGPAPRGVESTVLDPCASPMLIYRPGAVTAEQIREVAGAVEVFAEKEAADDAIDAQRNEREPRGGARPVGEGLPSPGGGVRHYAPRAKLVLVGAPERQLAARLAGAARGRQGEVVGVMLPEGIPAPPGVDARRTFAWGRWDAPEQLAQRLYAGLRALDAAGCTVILCPLPRAGGLGAAIRDRLQKAAK